MSEPAKRGKNDLKPTFRPTDRQAEFFAAIALKNIRTVPVVADCLIHLMTVLHISMVVPPCFKFPINFKRIFTDRISHTVPIDPSNVSITLEVKTELK